MKKNPDTEQNSFNVSRIYLVHYKGISIATLGDVSGGFGVFAIDESYKRAIFFFLPSKRTTLVSELPDLGGL